MDLKTIGLELLRDVKSRKFTLCLGYALLTYLNGVNEIGISSEDMGRILIAVCTFIIVEGLRDIAEAKKEL